MNDTRTLPGLSIRRAVSGDLRLMLEVERAAFAQPWSYLDLRRAYQHTSVIACVAERGSEVLGFSFCELRDDHLVLVNMAVRPAVRRMGVGSALLANAVANARWRHRNTLALTVGESNLVAQLFFRGAGFRAVAIWRHHYVGGDPHGYRMELRL